MDVFFSEFIGKQSLEFCNLEFGCLLRNLMKFLKRLSMDISDSYQRCSQEFFAQTVKLVSKEQIAVI